MLKEIKYQSIVDNLDASINSLEYDCLRSAGKTKFNAPTLNELYAIKDKLEEKLPKKFPKPIIK